VIITVTLNAAIDKSLSVPSFRLGRRHRTVDQTTMAGGKGVNVARSLKTLGQPVIATGFAGGQTGTRIVEGLTSESVLNDFVRITEVAVGPEYTANTFTSVADIEATVSTLSVARAWKRPYSFVLNQTPIRGQRVSNAAIVLGDEMSDDLSSVVAQPYIVMRNDHQDALGLGLAVIEYAPSGKSADEIRGLWQWVETRLNGGVSADEPLIISMLPASPDIVPTMFLPASEEAVHADALTS